MSAPTLVSQVTIEHLQALDFWSRVDVRGPDECWPWSRAQSQQGYGVVHIAPRITGLGRHVALYTHRVALSLSLGRALGASDVVDHRCYNTACCNPAHLDATTQLTNIRRSRKPLCRPTPFARKDGSVRWRIRWYDYSGPKRSYRARFFDSEAEARAFAEANREA